MKCKWLDTRCKQFAASFSQTELHSLQYSNGNEASWVQKERLLRFDREFARRTQIFDDQADFQAPATWMSEEERIEAEEKQNDRVESLQRQKQTLSLAFD